MFSNHTIEFKLNDNLREATFGKSGFYSAALKNIDSDINFINYHKDGDAWPDFKLKKLFSDGLFQHYVGVLCHFDFEYQYKQFEDAKLRLSNFDNSQFTSLLKKFEITATEDRKELVEWTSILRILWTKVKENDFLLELGVRFQRLKVKNEKGEERLKTLRSESKQTNADNQAIEQLFKQALANDQEMELLQTNICKWILDAELQIKNFFKAHNYQLNVLGALAESFVFALPYNIVNPYFSKTILSKLQDSFTAFKKTFDKATKIYTSPPVRKKNFINNIHTIFSKPEDNKEIIESIKRINALFEKLDLDKNNYNKLEILLGCLYVEMDSFSQPKQTSSKTKNIAYSNFKKILLNTMTQVNLQNLPISLNKSHLTQKYYQYLYQKAPQVLLP